MKDLDYGDEYVIPLKNGFTIRTDTYNDNPEGSSYVRVCDQFDHEIGYWIYTEWEEDPQLVMGAFLGCCKNVSGFMEVAEASDIVIELARANVLDDEYQDDPGLRAEAKRQALAIDTIEDFFTNVVFP